jgi:predicted RNA-binding Zn-ribbon protein involved in translation (DUF1610 family)
MKVLYYDLETAPSMAYVWQMWQQDIHPKQLIEEGRVTCWAAKWMGDRDKDVMFGAEWLDTGPTDFIEVLHELMMEADAIITFNGNKFDEPVMKTEFAKRGLAPPPPRKSIDMYRVVKRNFKLPYYRMDYVAQWLGLKGKKDTGGFELWVAIENGDPKARAHMEKYNKQDIKVLEHIYEKLKAWVPNHPSDHTGHVCPTCGSGKLQKRGVYRTKVSTFTRYQCTSCGSWSKDRIADKTAIKPDVVAI